VDAALWITAWATLGLFVAAVTAGILAWRTFKEQKEQNRRAQAVQIGAWTATRGQARPQGKFGLCLLNDSSLAVTDFEVWVPHREDPVDSQRYQVLPPGFYFAPSVSPVQGRYGHFDRFEPIKLDEPGLQPTTVHVESANVGWFSFVDAAGQRWRRTFHPGPGEAPLTRVDS
jgi:hypothetical protein